MFISKVKRLDFIETLLSDETDNDCGFQQLMQDFKQYVSNAIIEQFHGGKLNPQDKSTHKLII